MIPFANKEEGSVYEHLKRAINFSMTHLGKHGLPAGLYADWNDCLRLGADGESTFVALPILIASLRGADYMTFDMGRIYMMIAVAIVPIILVYLFLSKYIIAGVTLGGVKG